MEKDNYVASAWWRYFLKYHHGQPHRWGNIFHGVIHGFWYNHVTETASLEANLLKRLDDMHKEFLLKMFIDLNNAYDAMDREWCLYILEGCGVVPRTLWLIWHYWDKLVLMTRASGYYDEPFKGIWGVTQGNPLSLKLFNILVDAFVRYEKIQPCSVVNGHPLLH